MIFAAIGFVFGAWLLQQQPVLPSIYSLIAITICLIGLLFINLRFFKIHAAKWLGVYSKISIIVFAIGLGFLWAAGFALNRLSDELPKQWQQKNIQIIGVIASLPELTEYGVRFQFDVEKVLTQDTISSTTSKPARLKIPKHISLNFYQQTAFAQSQSLALKKLAVKQQYFHVGERWQFSVKLKHPHTTYNPHGFDFEAWALSENIRAVGNVVNKSAYVKLRSFVFKPAYIVEHFREKIGNRISQALVNKPYAGVIRALVMGDDSQISADNWTVYLRTGTNHLMSISGLHITMLAGLAFAVVAFVWRRVPTLVLWMPTRKAATIAGLIIAILYACLAGLSVPTQRTLLMLITFACALSLGRNLAISRALAIALIVVVLIDPWAVIAPGFWLSFSAVAFIAYVSAGRLQAQHWLASAVHTQWAITLGLLPILIVIFGQTSIVSPIANALAIPIISLIVVPLSILGSFLPVDFVLQSAHWVLEICMIGLSWLANVRMAVWQQAAPPAWAVLIATVGVLWLLLPRGFPQRWLGLVLLLPLFLVAPKKLALGEMQASVLDVGQGLSVVLKTANHTLLYDAGGRYSAQSDAGSRIVIPYLRSEGIQQLDGFIVSHNDADHSGGAASVLALMPTGWLVTSFGVPKEWQAKKTVKCFAGQSWQWDKVTFQVLYPSWASYDNADISDNNRSCVLKVTTKFGSILLTGDIEREAETKILQAYVDKAASDLLSSDVLVAPHHGSKTSSTTDFIQAVNAKHAIFTVGYLNRFKHPKPMIEQRYSDSGALIYRSDYQGAINIDFVNQQAFKIESLRQTKPRYWHDRYNMIEPDN